MPERKTCQTCRYWCQQEEYARLLGECRAFPPRAERWPKTGQFDWCGDHNDFQPERPVWLATMEHRKAGDGEVFDVVGLFSSEEDANAALYDAARELASVTGEGFRIVLPATGREGTAVFDCDGEGGLSAVEPSDAGSADDWDAWGQTREERIR